jgi:DNA-binding SARP family transcriptional activator
MGAGGARMTTGLTFRVLGRIEVIDDGRGAVSIGGPKERMVLAQLLARANATVSLDALIEGAWEGRPPRSAERSMRTYVARLRKALEPERQGADHRVLVTEVRGYRLNVEPGRFDALRFEALARQGAEELTAGDPTAAASTLRSALESWAGAAYAEFADMDAIAGEVRRLDELRLLAVEDRIDADLGTGAAAVLIAEIERLVGDHPFRERLWGQLMLALYRSGRQRDALTAYQRARTVMVDELGIAARAG